MRRLAFVVLSLVFLATACQPATTELTEEQKAQIAAAVMEASAAYTAVHHAEDLDGYMSYNSDWAKSPWGCCATIDDLRSFILAQWDRWDWESWETGEMKVMVLGPDAAVVDFTEMQVQVDTAGVRRETANELAFLWVREAGQWKLLVAKQHSQPVGT